MKKRNFTRMLLFLFALTATMSLGAANATLGDSCLANFYYSSQNGTVHFADTTTASVSVVKWNWQFGDGTSSNLRNPTHTYASNIYKTTVCLKVTTNDSASCNVCKEIKVRPVVDSCFTNFTYVRLDSTVINPRFRFTDTSFGSSKIISRRWVFSDSLVRTDSTFIHRFPSSMTVASVCLQTVTASGCTSNTCKTISIVTCKADFIATYQPDSVPGAMRYVFTNTSSPNATSFLWWFGDGANSTDKNPVHSYYMSPGSAVNVRLRIATNSHCMDTLTRTIIISRPISDSCFANFDYVRNDSLLFRFSDVSLAGNKIAWRRWTLSDSTQYGDSTFVHQFPSSLSKATVCLTIGTSTGCQSSICKTVILRDTVPVLCKAGFDFTYQQDTSHTGVQYDFINTSSNDAISYLWTSSKGDTSTLKNPSFNYYQPPWTIITVRLQIRTLSNCIDTFARTFTIPRLYADSCQANFTYERIDTTGTSPVYRFTDISYRNGPTAILWTLSDSTQGSSSSFVHQFSSNLSTARVCLVIANSGCQSSICKDILLKDTVPTSYCDANFSYVIAMDSTISSSRLKKKVYFTDLSTSSSTISYRWWSFGDGTYSQLKNPSHAYHFNYDTTVMVSLYIRSSNGCTDSIFKFINVPGYLPLFNMSGTVAGKNELLPQGIIVLYKKADNGYFNLVDANIVSNGLFSFDHLSTGKYLLYAIPDMYSTGKYLPTYYVNKVHWADAQIIDLKSNVYGLTLQMVSVKSLIGPAKTSGKIVYTGAVEQKSLKSGLAVTFQVNLYTESESIITSVTPDASGNFAFESLPYGKYIVRVEYPNLIADDLIVNLTPEAPEANNLEIVINNNITSVSSLSQSNKIIVYNVSTDQIAVRLTTSGKYVVSLTDISGQVIMNNQVDFEANTDKIISTGSLSTGIYILKLQNKDNTIVKKLLK